MSEVTATTSYGAHGYLNDLSRALAQLDEGALDVAVDMVSSSVRGGRTLLIAGNGGGAAVAEHMACDWRAAAVQQGLRPGRIVSLTENTARITAIANDHSYEEVFEMQIAEQGARGDLLVCLSVSGSSVNVLRGASCARERGMTVLSLVGRPSPLSELSDHAVLLDMAGDYGLTEDLQSLFVHLVARELRETDAHRVGPSARVWA